MKSIFLRISILVMIIISLLQIKTIYENSSAFSGNKVEKELPAANINNSKNTSLSEILKSIYVIDCNLNIININKDDNNNMITLDIEFKGDILYFINIMDKIKEVKGFSKIHKILDNGENIKKISISFYN